MFVRGVEMLKFSRIDKYYGDNVLIDSVDMVIKLGDIFGFISCSNECQSNVKTILNYVRKHCFDLSTITKRDVGYLPKTLDLDKNMTVMEMLKYNDSFYDSIYLKDGLSLAENMKIDVNKKIKDLSQNCLKKVGLVLTLMHKPRLIILEDSFDSFDVETKNIFLEILNDIRKNAVIFISSNNLMEIKKFCDRVCLIKNEKIVKVLSLGDLMQNQYSVITLYCQDVKKKNLPLKDMMIKELSNDMIKFVYKNDINVLINYLNEINISKLLIDDISLEDVFADLYRNN